MDCSKTTSKPDPKSGKGTIILSTFPEHDPAKVEFNKTPGCNSFPSASGKQRRIAVLGAGKIGEALISGLLSSGWREPADIVGSSRRRERVDELAERHGIVATLSNEEAVAGAALVVISVKPQDIEVLLGEIGHLITVDQTILSVAAAIPTATIERHLAPGVPVVRAMPNTPSVVHEGVAGLCAGAHADDAHVTLAEEALAHLGAVVRVPEKLMDAVTAVSGSGPAYFALLAEAMIEAGLLLGLSREISTQLVVQTMLGTAQQMRDLTHAPGRAARDGHLARRHDDRRDPRARDRRRPRRVPERDPGRHGALARARRGLLEVGPAASGFGTGQRHARLGCSPGHASRDVAVAMSAQGGRRRPPASGPYRHIPAVACQGQAVGPGLEGDPRLRCARRA